MKRQVIQLIALLCFCITGYAQTNGSFETLTITNPDYGFAFSKGQVSGWKQSHGTPSLTTNVAPGQGSRAAWMWSHSGKGEGIVQPYPFTKKAIYLVTFWVRTNNPDGNFYVKAANGVPNGTTTSFPSVSSKQTIFSDGLKYANWTKKSIIFTANADYAQLWIYPYLSSYPNNNKQAELMVDGIRILNLDDLHVSVYPNPTTEIVSVELPTKTEEASVVVYDLTTGRKVGAFKATKENNKWNIPSHIKDGIYQMVVTDTKSNAKKSLRLVVKRK